MSHISRWLLAAVVVVALSACSQSGSSAGSKAAVKLDTNAQKFGYAVGYDLGLQLKSAGDEIDMQAAEAGLQDSASGAKGKLDAEQRKKIKQTVIAEMRKKELDKRVEESKTNATASAAFLAKTAKQSGVKTTDDGLQYKVDREGKGDRPTVDDNVVINYKGSLPDGTVFDSSYKRGKPLTVPVAGVVPGFKEGLLLMKPGSKYTLYIPAELAYGAHGQGKVIGPNQALVFEVELLKVEKADSGKTAADETGSDKE